MLQSAANSSEVVVKAGSCTGRSVYLCIPNKVYQIDATALQLGLGVRAAAREGADMEGRRVGYRSEWSGRGRGQGERERERRGSCQGFGRGGACVGWVGTQSKAQISTAQGRRHSKKVQEEPFFAHSARSV